MFLIVLMIYSATTQLEFFPGAKLPKCYKKLFPHSTNNSKSARAENLYGNV